MSIRRSFCALVVLAVGCAVALAADFPYGETGPKDAPVHVLVFAYPSPCQLPAIDALKKLQKDSPKLLRVTVERPNSQLAKKMKIGCASYLMRVKGVTPPKAKANGEYEVLFTKSPEAGKWKVDQLTAKVKAGLKKAAEKQKSET